MPNPLIQHIVADFKSLISNVLLIENNDGFLLRNDVIEALMREGMIVKVGNQLEHRIAYELGNLDSKLLLVSDNTITCLEDIENNSSRIEFFLNQYIQGYHIPTIIDLPLKILDQFYLKKEIIPLSKTETDIKVHSLSSEPDSSDNQLILDQLINEIKDEVSKEKPDINWTQLGFQIGELINKTIGQKEYNETVDLVAIVNDKFQEFRELRYNSTKSSNYTKHPHNVCKILEYLNFKFKEEKIALIVIDGMSLWQYNLLANHLPGIKYEKTTLAWIPSITQLSRQAIFRGGIPEYDYRQGPTSEERLWAKFWSDKGIAKHQIKYMHSESNIENIHLVTRLAIVYKELDAKMHGNCDDYVDLKSLTENWIERSGIARTVSDLLNGEYKIFITTDHGNVEATGWRGLTSREKLGMKHKSGSRGERHLEYSEQWLYDEFVANNEDILDSIVKEDQALYFKNNQSFSRKDRLVTHGGAHFLEVVIPFIEISNDE